MAAMTETSAAHRPYDLPKLFQQIGVSQLVRAAIDPPERHDADVEVQMLETDPVPVRGEPLPVDGFVDGIQNALVVAHHGHRPVHVAYTAAGASGPGPRGPRLSGLVEQLAIICSSADRGWVDEINPVANPLPVTELDVTSPPEVGRAAALELGSARDGAERQLVTQMLADGVDRLVVDGALAGRPADSRLVGVVKTTRTRYLPDEKVLWGLPAGWRSPVFLLPPSGGCRVDRYSCYVRLHDASRAPWDFGLIRLETFDAELLDSLAVLAFAERQFARSRDGRWDRHLESVAVCEKLLKARKPRVFDLAR